MDNFSRSKCTSLITKNMSSKYIELYALLVGIRLSSLLVRQGLYTNVFSSTIENLGDKTSERAVKYILKKAAGDAFKRAEEEAAERALGRAVIEETGQDIAMRYLTAAGFFKPPVIGTLYDIGSAVVTKLAVATGLKAGASVGTSAVADLASLGGGG